MNIDIGKGLQVFVDVARLRKHDAVVEKMLLRAASDILRDTHAGITEKTHPDAKARRDEALSVAMKKLESMYAGELRSNSGAPRASALTPVEKEAYRLAREYVSKNAGQFEKNDKHALWLMTAAELMGMAYDDLKAVFAAAIKRRAANPKVIAIAEENVARMDTVVGATEEIEL